MTSPFFQLPIARWAEWDTQKTDQVQPKLDFVEPMLRRRLSSLAKTSLWVAHQCAHDLNHVRTIYASRHGELTRTTDMLKDLAQGETLSPTSFSMSVLNASLGLYSIIRGNTAPATAISAGDETFAYALLEAHLQLSSHPDASVLLVYADEPTPAIYSDAAQLPTSAHALALLLNNNADTRINCQRIDTTSSDSEIQSRTFVRVLETQTITHWHGPLGGWEWGIAA